MMAKLANRFVLVFLAMPYFMAAAVAADKIPCETADEMASKIYSRVASDMLLMRSATLSLAGEDLKVIHEYSNNCEGTRKLMEKLIAAAAIARKKEDESGGANMYGLQRDNSTRGGVGVSGHGMPMPEVNVRGIQQQIQISP